MKICNHCGQEKDEREFNKNASLRDGLRGDCRKCQSNDNTERAIRKIQEGKTGHQSYYMKNRSKILARSQEGRIKAQERNRRYQEDNMLTPNSRAEDSLSLDLKKRRARSYLDYVIGSDQETRDLFKERLCR